MGLGKSVTVPWWAKVWVIISGKTKSYHQKSRRSPLRRKHWDFMALFTQQEMPPESTPRKHLTSLQETSSQRIRRSCTEHWAKCMLIGPRGPSSRVGFSRWCCVATWLATQEGVIFCFSTFQFSNVITHLNDADLFPGSTEDQVKENDWNLGDLGQLKDELLSDETC